MLAARDEERCFEGIDGHRLAVQITLHLVTPQQAEQA
jgi:hypothetical protein